MTVTIRKKYGTLAEQLYNMIDPESMKEGKKLKVRKGYREEKAIEDAKQFSDEEANGRKVFAYTFRSSLHSKFVEQSQRCYQGDLTERIASLFGRRGATAVEIMSIIDNAAKALLVMGRPVADIAGGSIFQMVEQPAHPIFINNWSAETPPRPCDLSFDAMPANPGKKMHDYCVAKGTEFVLSVRMGHVTLDNNCYRVNLTRYGITLVPETIAAQNKPVSITNSKNFLNCTCWEFGQLLRNGEIKLSGPGGHIETADAEWAPFDGDNFFMPDYIYAPMPGEPVISGESPYTQWPKVSASMLPMLAMSWFADAMARLGAWRSIDGPFGTHVFLWHIWREYCHFYTANENCPKDNDIKFINNFDMHEIYKTDDDLIPFVPLTLQEETIYFKNCIHDIQEVNLASNVWGGLFLPFLHEDDARTLRNVCSAATSQHYYEQADLYFWPFVGLSPILQDLQWQEGVWDRAKLTDEEYTRSWMMPPAVFKKLMSLPEAVAAEEGIREFYSKLPDTVPAVFRKSAVPLPQELLDKGYTVPSKRAPLEQMINKQMWHGVTKLKLH